MAMGKVFTVFLGLGVITAGLTYYFCPCMYKDPEPPQLPDEYFGKGIIPADVEKFPKDDPAIKKFVVQIEDSILKDLKIRLNNTRFVEPLDNIQFQFGFHATYLKEVVEYWKTKYDWKKHEKELNKFDHFKTQIEGIQVHFIHQKPNVKGKKVRVIPLLLIHGWPGSVVEFQKILPLLTTPREGRDYVFEVICPSLPGYGFSEAPHQPGFSQAAVARVFSKLMDRLGHNQFYIQGGDWGSFIGSTIAKVYPKRVLGFHTSMPMMNFDVVGTLKYILAYYLPSQFMTPEEHRLILPYMKFIYLGLEEMGHSHIQFTKPDTVSAGLSDSPAGLAAYILEKFTTWTDVNNTKLPDGGLTKKFTLDELLTNVMVYWSTNSIASSTRLYKEFYGAKHRAYAFEKIPVKVATGIAIFPNELVGYPRCLLQTAYRNIVRYNIMPRGGHFSAMEEPKLLADDVWDFVVDVEKSSKEQKPVPV